MRAYRKYLLLCIGLMLLLLVAFPAGAQENVTDDEVNAVAKELYCPVCENTPLDVCPTQACQDWREVIRTQLAEGRSEEQIKDYFALQYGDRVLAEPPQQGFNLLVWVLPIGAVVIGGVFFVSYMRNLQKRSAETAEVEVVADVPTTDPGSQPIAKDDYVSRVEQELRNQS